jgi:hypothetical protein
MPRKTKFFDIPVHESTRNKLKQYKEKMKKNKETRKIRSYDDVINNILKNIGDFDLGGM